MSWTTYIPTIATGVVGVLGILGSQWQAKRARDAQASNLQTTLEANAKSLQAGITAEDARASLAEKRRIYANCLSTLTFAFIAEIDLKVITDKSSDEHITKQREAIRARFAAVNASTEVKLIGPEEIGDLAKEAVESVLKVGNKQGNDEFSAAHTKLTRAMRQDLGVKSDSEDESRAH